jgi:hemerythrin-like domain-containing protein
MIMIPSSKTGEFEWNYLERGPQVWKVEIGKNGGCRCGHQHFEKATEALKQEHQVIEKVLAGLQRLMQSPEAAPLDVWRKALDFISNFADRCHHLKEEEILFPALEERGMPSEEGPIGMMLFEHEQGRAYVRAMLEALELAAQDPEAATPTLFENAAAYSRLLQQHIDKENEILVEMADGALTPQEQKDLLRAFEEHEEKEMGSGVHQKYLKIAEELERYSQ